jgi:ethanolamine utilization protein EutM/ethanolamine utilization protein EutN
VTTLGFIKTPGFSITALVADAAERRAEQLGSRATVRRLSRPADAMESLIHFPNAENPLYGGRDQMLPSDYPKRNNKIMNTKREAIGILETQGLTAIFEAADAMLKAATAAVDAGAKVVGSLGKLIAAHVIARPHDDLTALLPN